VNGSQLLFHERQSQSFENNRQGPPHWRIDHIDDCVGKRFSAGPFESGNALGTEEFVTGLELERGARRLGVLIVRDSINNGH
jgi:hypothetical protein